MAARKYAVVTGGASGIGAACVSSLLGDGWHVYALDVSDASLQSLADAEHGARERLRTIVCDVRHADAVASAFAEIRESTDAIHALVCSAGILRTGSLRDAPVDDFDAVFSVNVRGSWLAAKYAIPLLETAARRDNLARIVAVSSIAAIRPKVGGGIYAASKAALNQLVRVLSVEMADKGILVNAVAPATVDTPFLKAAQSASPDGTYRVSGKSPLGRVAVPGDIVPVIRMLLSDAAGYINGATIPVDGGTSAAFVGR